MSSVPGGHLYFQCQCGIFFFLEGGVRGGGLFVCLFVFCLERGGGGGGGAYGPSNRARGQSSGDHQDGSLST